MKKNTKMIRATAFALMAVVMWIVPCNGDATTESEDILAQVQEWLAPYQTKCGQSTLREEDATYLYGTFGLLPSVFSTFDITVAVFAKEREVEFIAYLPTIVPKNRRKSMIEFIFRGEWEYGISTASIILEDDGRVRCQAWLPFECFASQPKESKWRLMGAVVDKLWSFSEGVASVALGGDPVTAAAGIKRIAAFEGLDEAEALRTAADVDTKIVLERCFYRDADIKVGVAENEWLEKLSGSGGDVRVGVIDARFEELIRDVGGRYDVLPYSLVVREGMVWNICNVPETCPRETISEVADVLMRQNQQLKYSLYGMDFETGKVWCHYSLPVSVIPDGDDERPRNLYGAFIKIIPIQSVARDSEALHSVMVKKSQSDGDDAPESSAKEESVGEVAAPVALPLLTKMLDAHSAWESARWDLSNTNSLEVATKKRIADRRYMRYCADGQTDEERFKSWPFDVDAFEDSLAQKMVSGKYGLYCVKGECNDYNEGVLDDGNVAVNPSMRWMNRKMEEWATNALDGVYGRLPNDKMVQMLGANSVNAGTFCWTVGTNEYFIIQRVDEDYTFESRDYIYMIWDGVGEPVIVATFNSMPNSMAMSAVRSCMVGNPVGRNNMAALMWNNVADRGEADSEIIRLLLGAAKIAGVEVAAENIDIMESSSCTQ